MRPESLDGALELVPPARVYTHTKRTRARTLSTKRISKRDIELGRRLYPDLDVPRPETRADCVQGVNAERPCPFVSCKYHLFLDVSPRSGSIKVNFPNLEVWEMTETCALDVADRSGITLEGVGAIMNLTRERVRQLETRGVAKLKALAGVAAMFDEASDEEPQGEAPQPDEAKDRDGLVEDLSNARGFTSGCGGGAGFNSWGHADE